LSYGGGPTPVKIAALRPGDKPPVDLMLAKPPLTPHILSTQSVCGQPGMD